MKTIGLIGGMTWHSTVEYYRLINAGINQRLGKSHSSRCVLYSVDFEEVERLQAEGGWDALSVRIADAARRVQQAGAEMLLICANTMHMTARAVEAAVTIPLIHIADATAADILKQGLDIVGLLGTRFTMELEFYRKRLEERHGLTVLIPPKEERDTVHDIIYRELGHGRILDSSRESYKKIIGNLQSRGAQGIILGCTEIPLLIGPQDSPIPVFDTTALHAAAAVDAALQEP